PASPRGLVGGARAPDDGGEEEEPRHEAEESAARGGEEDAGARPEKDAEVEEPQGERTHVHGHSQRDETAQGEEAGEMVGVAEGGAEMVGRAEGIEAEEALPLRREEVPQAEEDDRGGGGDEVDAK